MASPATPENNVAQKRAAGAITNDDDSDYGSDFSLEEELIVERLISGQQVPAIEDNPIVNEFENHGASSTIRLPRILGREQQSPLFKAAMDAERIAKHIRNSVKDCEYPDLSNRIPDSEQATPSEAPTDQPKLKDTRSPLERFRTQPKKALSVTDLVSPAWCELQYWYTLTIHGRKRRTPAMKQGSVVHQKLEDQIHTTVKVDVESKEDAWGLRIWNVIQGLRTLRDTGQTRELEIWGTIDGLVVNGIIDDISYICPDTELEESLTKSKDDEPLPMTDQTTIEDFFKRKGGSSLLDATRTQRRAKSNKIYLCDVKTRGVRTLPSAAAFRPTKMQLMLYHRLLLALATNTVDFSILTARYDLNAHAPFSDAFLAQVGSVNDEVFYDALTDPEDDSSFPSSQDSMGALLAHNSLSALWSLMIMEFQRTLPDGPASLGNILKAEYRSRDTGEITGSKTFAMDDQVLKSYLDHEMQWWKGQREAEGVAVEEAYKCRSCDFAETCEWRLKKVEAAIERARAIKMRRTSAV